MGTIDWKKLSAVNLTEIEKTQNHPAIQENLANILNCRPASEFDMSSVDPNFHKLFNLAQLTIKSLMESQSYLSGVIVAMGDKLKMSQEKCEEQNEGKEVANERASRYKKKCTILNKMMNIQQQILSKGQDGECNCQFCSKSFVSLDYLVLHMRKRHSECLQKFNPNLLLSCKNHGIVASESAQTDLGELRTKIGAHFETRKESTKKDDFYEILSDLKSGILKKVDEKFASDKINEEIEAKLQVLKTSFEGELKDLSKNQEKIVSQIESLSGGRSSLTPGNHIGDMETDPNEDQLRQVVQSYEEKIRFNESRAKDLLRKETDIFQCKLDDQERQHESRVEELVSIIDHLRLQIKRMEGQIKGDHKKVKTNAKDPLEEKTQVLYSRPPVRTEEKMESPTPQIEYYRKRVVALFEKELHKIGVAAGAKTLEESQYIIIMDCIQTRTKNKLTDKRFFDCRQQMMVELERRMAISSSASLINSTNSMFASKSSPRISTPVM